MVLLNLTFWTLHAHPKANNAIANAPSIDDRTEALRWQRQECLCYLKAVHRPLKTISTGVRVATGFPSTSAAGLNFQCFTALTAS
jgi:hypothetical protein